MALAGAWCRESCSYKGAGRLYPWDHPGLLQPGNLEAPKIVPCIFPVQPQHCVAETAEGVSTVTEGQGRRSSTALEVRQDLCASAAPCTGVLPAHCLLETRATVRPWISDTE